MKPGVRTITLGIAIFVCGAFVIPLAIVIPLLFSGSGATQFLVPGRVEVTIEEPGRYYVWNDYQTLFESVTYNRPEALPDGLQIAVQNEQGDHLPFISDGTISSTMPGGAKRSVGYVEVEQTGVVAVEVLGDVEAQVFSFSKSNLLKFFALIFGGVGLSILVGMGGMIVGLIGVIKLAQGANKRSA